MRVKPGGPKRPGRSVVRSGRASPGRAAGTRRVHHDLTRPGVRPGRGALPLGGAVPRWCAWAVGVADVTSGV